MTLRDTIYQVYTTITETARQFYTPSSPAYVLASNTGDTIYSSQEDFTAPLFFGRDPGDKKKHRRKQEQRRDKHPNKSQRKEMKRNGHKR